MRLPKYVAAFTALGAFCVVAAACGSDPTATPTPRPTATPTAMAMEPTPTPTAMAMEGDKEVTLDLIDAFPTVLDISRGTQHFIDKVSELSGGTVTINRVGGPEVTHSLEQFQPVRDGVFQAIVTVGAYHTDFTKQGLGENVAANYNFVEDNFTPRVECGMFEALEDIYEPLGVQYVAAITGGWGARLWTIEPIESLDQFDGLHLRAATIYQAFLHDYGATTTPLQFSEIYPALEKGVIKGLYWGGTGAKAGNWQEVLKYQYPNSLAGGGGLGIMFNQEAWDGLSEKQQQAVYDAVASASEYQTAQMNDVEIDEWQFLRDAGVEPIEWPEDVAAQFTGDHYDKIIQEFIVDPNPTLGDPLAKSIRCVNEQILPNKIDNPAGL